MLLVARLIFFFYFRNLQYEIVITSAITFQIYIGNHSFQNLRLTQKSTNNSHLENTHMYECKIYFLWNKTQYKYYFIIDMSPLWPPFRIHLWNKTKYKYYFIIDMNPLWPSFKIHLWNKTQYKYYFLIDMNTLWPSFKIHWWNKTQYKYYFIIDMNPLWLSWLITLLF